MPNASSLVELVELPERAGRAQVTRFHPQPTNHHHHEVATAFAQ